MEDERFTDPRRHKRYPWQSLWGAYKLNMHTRMNLTKTLLAGSAAALMLAPFAASAHEGGLGLKLGGSFGKDNNPGLHLSLGSVFGVRAGDDNRSATSTQKERDNEEHAHATSTVDFKGNATTTAARLTARANRVETIADLMGSLSTTLATKISGANLSASSTADANAKLGDYNTNVASAKAQGQAALSAAGSINGSNSTTTNTAFTTQAQADLSSAQSFLKTAAQDLHNILKLIFQNA